MHIGGCCSLFGSSQYSRLAQKRDQIKTQLFEAAARQKPLSPEEWQKIEDLKEAIEKEQAKLPAMESRGRRYTLLSGVVVGFALTVSLFALLVEGMNTLETENACSYYEVATLVSNGGAFVFSSLGACLSEYVSGVERDRWDQRTIQQLEARADLVLDLIAEEKAPQEREARRLPAGLVVAGRGTRLGPCGWLAMVASSLGSGGAVALHSVEYNLIEERCRQATLIALIVSLAALLLGVSSYYAKDRVDEADKALKRDKLEAQINIPFLQILRALSEMKRAYAERHLMEPSSGPTSQERVARATERCLEAIRQHATQEVSRDKWLSVVHLLLPDEAPLKEMMNQISQLSHHQQGENDVALLVPPELMQIADLESPPLPARSFQQLWAQLEQEVGFKVAALQLGQQEIRAPQQLAS